MESSKKPLFLLIIAVVVVIIGILYFKAPGMGQSEVVKEKPALSEDQLLGKAPITEAVQSDVEKHKAELLARVRDTRPLTAEEKQTIARIMLMEAHVYGFTEEERTTIFSALQK